MRPSRLVTYQVCRPGEGSVPGRLGLVVAVGTVTAAVSAVSAMATMTAAMTAAVVVAHAVAHHTVAHHAAAGLDTEFLFHLSLIHIFGNDFMQRMGLMNHQYIIVKRSGTEKNRRQAHLHILANRVSLSGELYKDNWIGKRATEAANSIARERNLVQSKDIGKANREEIKQAMESILARMQGFDLAGFSRELEKLGFKVREARASTGKLNGYYVTSRSGTEYKACLLYTSRCV